MMRLPQLLDGLGRGRIDVVTQALDAHFKAFKDILKQLPWEDVNAWNDRIENHMQKMAVLFETVCNQVKSETVLPDFSHSTIQITLSHINLLSHELQSHISNKIVKKHAKVINELLTFHQHFLEGLLLQPKENLFSVSSSFQRGSSPAPQLTAAESKLWRKWETLGDEEIINHALQLNPESVLLMKDFLKKRKKFTKEDIEEKLHATLNTVLLKELNDKKFDKAVTVLTNAGRDALLELREMCLHTLTSNVRNYLAFELNKQQVLDPNEVSAWKFLLKLEEVLKNSFWVIDENGRALPNLNNSDKKSEKICISISWVLTNTDDIWKQTIAMQLFFETLDRVLEPYLDMKLCWEHLLITEKLELVELWIHSVYKSSMHSKLESLAHNRLVLLFSSWNLADDMVDSVLEIQCSPRVRDHVLDLLARFGVYSSQETSDIQKKLRRLIRTQQFVEGVKSEEKLLVRFCVEQNFPDVLATLKLQIDEELNQYPWVQLYSDFEKLNRAADDNSLVQKCLLNTAAYLGLSLESSPYLVIASALLSGKTLKEILLNNEDVPPGVSDSLKDVLESFPMFKRFVDGSSFEKERVDITHFQLLKDILKCNIDHLFLHQHPSICENDNKLDIWRELPHFSSERLIAKYGHNEILGFRYYLKQGRPSFASTTVIVEQHRSYGELSRKMFKKPCYAAHGLALSNFTDPRITGACIAFIEMLGGNSVVLRTHIAAARCIWAYRKNHFDDESSLNYTKCLLEKLALGEREKTANELLINLQKCIPCEMNIQGVQNHGLSVRLAQIHHLPSPTHFLKCCAEQNNWSLFLIFAQLYGYPLSLIKSLISNFKCPILKQHLAIAVCHAASSDSKFLKVSSRTSRQHFYSRVFKDEVVLNAKQQTSQSQNNSGTGNSIEDPERWQDIFHALVVCHEMENSAHALLMASQQLENPILSVFALCYNCDLVMEGLSAWLRCWLPKEDSSPNLNSSLQEFEQLLLMCIEKRGVSLVKKGLKLFFPEHILVPLLQGLEDCTDKKSFGNVIYCFKKFEAICENLKEKSLNEEEIKTPFSSDGNFICKLGKSIAKKVLQYGFSSIYHQLQFLRILIAANFFHEEERNPDLLLKILEIFSSNGVVFDLKCWFRKDEELKRCIDTLLEKENFSEALDVAQLLEMETTSICVSEQLHNFEKWNNTNYESFKKFCTNCNERFVQYEVEAIAVCKFYHGCASQLLKNEDKWLAEHFALSWIHKCSDLDDKDLLLEIEKSMWLYSLKADRMNMLQIFKEELKPTPLYKLSCEKLGISSVGFQYDSTGTDLDVAWEPLINELLDIGDISSASRIRKVFGVQHQDLGILESCIMLVEEEITPNEIPTTLVTLLSQSQKASSSSPRRFSYLRGPSLDSNARIEIATSAGSAGDDFTMIPSPEKQNIFTVLQLFCDTLKHGKQLGKQLAACYQLAMNLDFSFKNITKVEEPLKLLRTALSECCWNHYSVASDVMMAFQLSPKEAAQFISREVVAAISKHCFENKQVPCMMWGYDLETNFRQVLDLVPDSSLLGAELLGFVSKLGTSEKQTPREILDTATELLIRAHDCYTAVCNMEGITTVLRAARAFTTSLAERMEWSLMVRLLTGIQRYTEMNYIFKILKENDEFEFLLRKEATKPVGFKLALIEWLRKESPGRKALKMTAAHFNMHHEEAALWEADGFECLEKLVKTGLKNNSETKALLQTVIQNFTHAAECYLQANMLNQAVGSAHQAELVALQLHFVTSSQDQSIQQVVLLDSKAVTSLINNVLGFHEGRIVANAYNHHCDWGAILFNHCVVGSTAESYLSLWISSMQITPTIIRDVANRFKRASVVNRTMATNMRNLLNHVPDISIRYQIASELDFKDVVTSLLEIPEASYIKDTAYQSGFRSSR